MDPHLTVTKSLLVPQMISDVPEKIKSRKQKQKFYYDRHSHELPTLHDGDAVRMRSPGENGRLEKRALVSFGWM